MGAGRASVVWRRDRVCFAREAESEGSISSWYSSISVQPSESLELEKLRSSLEAGECTDPLREECLVRSG